MGTEDIHGKRIREGCRDRRDLGRCQVSSTKETMKGTATNVFGYYVLNLPPGTHTVVMSYVGYEDDERRPLT